MIGSGLLQDLEAGCVPEENEGPLGMLLPFQNFEGEIDSSRNQSRKSKEENAREVRRLSFQHRQIFEVRSLRQTRSEQSDK